MPHSNLKSPAASRTPRAEALPEPQRIAELFRQLAPLIGNQEPRDLCERACELIARLLQAEACSLLRATACGTQLTLAAATHIASEAWGQLSQSVGVGACGRVYSSGAALLIENEEQFLREFGRPSSPRYGAPSCMIVPLEAQGRIEGVINIAAPVGRTAFGPGDLELLRAAAGLIGSTLATAIQSTEFRLSHRSLEDIFDSLHIGIITVSTDGHVVHTNNRARILLGLRLRSCDHPHLSAVLPGTVFNVCQRLIRHAGNGNGEDNINQDRITIQVGERERMLEITTGRLAGLGGEAAGSLIVIEDAGQDEEIKRLRESEGMKHSFLSIISHELRTPLAVIRSAVPLIDPSRGRDIEADTLRQVHHLMMKNCQRLGDVISSILDVTEIESGTLQLNTRETDLHELLDEAVAMQAENAAHRGLAWDCRFDAERHQMTADARRLRQVFSEMIANAIKFSNPGGKIAILTRVRTPWFEISITNNGARIAPEQRKQIFEKFMQAGPAMTRTAGGCGLGLFLVQNLLRLHGGEVELLQSEEDATTFIIRLPLENASGDNAECGMRNAENA